MFFSKVLSLSVTLNFFATKYQNCRDNRDKKLDIKFG